DCEVRRQDASDEEGEDGAGPEEVVADRHGDTDRAGRTLWRRRTLCDKPAEERGEPTDDDAHRRDGLVPTERDRCPEVIRRGGAVVRGLDVNDTQGSVIRVDL